MIASPLLIKTKAGEVGLFKDTKNYRTGYSEHFRDKAYSETPQTLVSASQKITTAGVNC